jgi:hypothetical protein
MTDKKKIYENGKIYTIRSLQTDKYYIGSTCNPLYKRLGQHKSTYKKYITNNEKYHYITSFEVVKYEDCFIELLENYKCNSKDELNKREGELIRLYKDNVVNKEIAGRTKKEWRVDNKNKIANQQKDYMMKNKEKYDEWFKKKMICECGSTHRISDKSKHIKTKKHIKYIETKES